MSDQANAAAPLCAAPHPRPRAPGFRFPPQSCDTHAHICGPSAKYLYDPARIYTPPDALLPDYRYMLETLGVSRAVLVQPSVYGTDNSALIDALATDPKRLRGVAVIKPDTPFAELERMHAAGVRGVRCNIVDVKEGRGKLPMAMLLPLARRIQPLGWHLEFLMHVDEFPDLDKLLDGFPVATVFGHLGYMRTIDGKMRGMDDPGFKSLLRLLQTGRAWVKLTGPYRISTGTLPYADVTPFAHALLEAAPTQIVWGSDWPHVMVKGAMPNDGDLADCLAQWVPDQKMREQVLAHNPARLYEF
ncbi:MAG TPA: amidohydrolase family protein [Burkholderiales bacterium]